METKNISALQQGYISCRHCHTLLNYQSNIKQYCPLCHSRVSPRIPHSVSRSWALLLSAFFLYIPANVLPIMSINKAGVVRTDTIMSGIIHLYNIEMQPIALIVFIASILVPLLKMLAVGIILLAIQLRWQDTVGLRSHLYHWVEFVGRWSMLDIFVISILLGVVKFSMASVSLEPAAFLFELVVILSMLSALQLDSRLIWDVDNDRD